MSRGFVKEDDQEEAPFVPPRAPLPDGLPNYVTPRGLSLLHAERDQLMAQRAEPGVSEDERRRLAAEVQGRLELLLDRIRSARLVEPASPPAADVRFGSAVTVRFLSGPQQGAERTLTIVGVDEASVAEQRIAFTAPVARALMGRQAGDTASFKLGAADVRMEVVRVG